MVKTRDLRGFAVFFAAGFFAAAFFARVRAGLGGDFLAGLAGMEEYYSVMDCHTMMPRRQRYMGNRSGRMMRMIWRRFGARCWRWRCAGGAVRLLPGGRNCRQTSGPWVMEKSGTTAGLRGIHAVGGGVAWASGTNGTVLRTEDGGYEWQSCAMPPGAEKLDFRGIWAWDDNTAIVMSSGTGEASRIYKTVDGCSSWKLLFTNPDKDGFWDAIVFQNGDYGFAIGDALPVRFLGIPVEGRFDSSLCSTDMTVVNIEMLGARAPRRSEARVLLPRATRAFVLAPDRPGQLDIRIWNWRKGGRVCVPLDVGTSALMEGSEKVISGVPGWSKAAVPLAGRQRRLQEFSL